MSPFWIELLGILFLLALVAFFSASEVAVLATRKSRMQELSDGGDKRASVVLGFQNNPEGFLAAVHVGMVFSVILASGLGGIMGVEYLVPLLAAGPVAWIREWSDWISLTVMVGVTGSLVVVFGELVPKSLALRFAETVSLRVASGVYVFSAVFRHPIALLTGASNLFLAPFKDRTTFTESRISEEEFKLMLEEGTKTGVIDSTEHELIRSVFEFTDTTAREVMIPRPDVVALNVDTPRDEIVRVVLEEGYSRMPVYRGTIDNIIGVIYTKDLLGLLEHRNLILIQDVIRPAYFVPETIKISRLMRELQQRKLHMAIVIDEFGGTEGLVTLEDIVEEIVGEIHDEYDEELKDVEAVADGSFLVNGRIPVRDFNERFQADIPTDQEYETVSGFVNKVAGRIPELHEEILHGGLAFAIVKKSQRRIRVLRVRKLTGGPGPVEGGAGA
ncbi:MAG: hemolysin family protein [Bacteroidota bacterium]